MKLGYQVDGDEVLTVVELACHDMEVAVQSLQHALEVYGQRGLGLVVVWTGEMLDAASVHGELARWAQSALPKRGLAVVVPPRWVVSMRGISADVAALGGLVGVFSELAAAKVHALREGSIWWVDEGQLLEPATLRTGRGCSPSGRMQCDGARRREERPSVSPG